MGLLIELFQNVQVKMPLLGLFDFSVQSYSFSPLILQYYCKLNLLSTRAAKGS